MDVDTLLTLFSNKLTAAGRTPGTIGWYEYELRRFFSWLEGMQLHTQNWLRPEIVEAYLAADRRKGNAPATIAGHYRALRAFFAWLVERRLIPCSPIEQVPPPKVPRKVPKRTTVREYLDLLESIPQASWIDLRDRLIIHVLFLAGLRLAECARLTAASFRPAERVIAARVKGNKDHLVPLLPAVERALVAYLFARPPWPDERLFLAANGGGKPRGVIEPNGIRQMIRRRCRRAGIRLLNPHAFRHGLAMLLLNEGGDLSLVQRILGHSRIQTTQRYAEWLTDGVIREYEEKMRWVDE